MPTIPRPNSCRTRVATKEKVARRRASLMSARTHLYTVIRPEAIITSSRNARPKLSGVVRSITARAPRETIHTIHAPMYQRVMVLLLTSSLPYFGERDVAPRYLRHQSGRRGGRGFRAVGLCGSGKEGRPHPATRTKSKRGPGVLPPEPT